MSRGRPAAARRRADGRADAGDGRHRGDPAHRRGRRLPRIIILTTFDLDEYAFAGLQAGASAFLLKDVAPEELVHAVRLVASGDAVVAPRVTQRLLETYVRRRRRRAAAPPVARSGTRCWRT